MKLLEIVHPTKGRLFIDPKEWPEWKAKGCWLPGEEPIINKDEDSEDE